MAIFRLFAAPFAALLLLLAPLTAMGQPVSLPGTGVQNHRPVSGYLPFGDVEYNPSIRTPADFLGYDLDERIPDWSDVLRYLEYLAQASDRACLKTFGKTFEQRPFVQLVLTAPQNQARLEALRQAHLAMLDPARSAGADLGDMPLFVNLGGSVHGNEISGHLAMILLAYHYAAATDVRTRQALSRMVLVITPGFNPDGICRYAEWINANSSLHHFPDSQQREEREAAPSSRSNHYWMDSNRDWLTAQYPEGQNFVRMYEYWMPHVLLDAHEQRGTRNLFYFSPGDANRTYAYIPQKNQDLTLAISRYTEKAIQSFGIPYLTRSGYDDFFIGKGACYGDIQGSVCILHEATASNGHIRSNAERTWTLAETIRWQAYAAQGVVDGALAHKQELLEYQRDFYIDAAKAAAQDAAGGYVFNARGDRAVAWHFVENLQLHDIDVYRISGETDRYYVPFRQRHYYKIKGIFEDITEYADSVFYDISTWSPARAYGLDFALQDAPEATGMEKITTHPFPAGQLVGLQEGALPESFAFRPGAYYSPWLMADLQQRGIRLEVVTEPFSYPLPPVTRKSRKAPLAFCAGTVLVPLEGQPVAAPDLVALLREDAARSAVDLTALYPGDGKKGFRPDGLARTPVRTPRTAIVTGNAQPQGSLWHMLDARFGMVHSLVEPGIITGRNADLDRYNAIILSMSAPSGNPDFYANLRAWIEKGGTLILFRGARSAGEALGIPTPKAHIGNGIKGSVLHADVCRESPLTWGYAKELDLYKHTATAWEVVPGLEVQLAWSQDPYRSGCVSRKNLARIAGTPAVVTARLGKGAVVYFQEEINFRSYWFASNHLLTNALYFGDLL